ncbi:hypothetical protein ACWDAO_20120 [Streptomyces sp. NPDC001212]|uniref:hypothetical protein n=1 Tax=Streptomyces sp. HYC2 TaxID=2955207 RepID=UPI0024804FD0|nr:hypothetical protein [Streptomyces sp. HYC2]
MSDLPPGLPRLRILETWLVLTLDRVRQQIATADSAASRPGRPHPTGSSKAA